MQTSYDIRRVRLVDASTNIASAGRTPLWSYVFSTSFNGLSDRKLKNSFRGVFISVQMLAAVFAVELAHFQADAGVNVAAVVTPLATRKPTVSNAQLPPIHLVKNMSTTKTTTRKVGLKAEVSTHNF
jgi:hypothetical protein